MASKGQKFHKYTKEEKEGILKKYNEGISSGFIAKEYGISSSTIREWKYKANHPELISSNKKGRPKEKDVHGLIIHSDQGFQYTSNEYKVICESNGITISMTRKETPIDDSPIESWHSLLKKKLCTIIILHFYKNIFNL